MSDEKKGKNRENTLLGRPFFDMILEVFAPPFGTIGKEKDNAINPAKQPDSETIKNGAD